MVNLPTYPFKASLANNEDSLLNEAERDRKHFEPCWCKSGKKFKKCHKYKSQEAPLELGQILSMQQKIMWRTRSCMHPLASNKSCKGKVIDSHSIQKKGPLKSIVDNTGHVFCLKPKIDNFDLELKAVGWRKASIFPGYCSFHDSNLFKPLEENDFTGEHLQCVLLAFRNLCYEYYKKNALIEAFEFQRSVVDRGKDLDHQIHLQQSYIKTIKGQKKSLNESEKLRKKFENAITTKNYSAFQSKCFFFDGRIDVVSSSVFQCEFDFMGNKLVDMWDLKIDAELLSHSIVNTVKGGAIVLVWLKEELTSQQVVKSFENISSDEKGDIFIQYCFLNCENTFFSKKWWKGLSENQKLQIHDYAKSHYYEGGKFSVNHERLVDWIF